MRNLIFLRWQDMRKITEKVSYDTNVKLQLLYTSLSFE